MTTIEQWKSRAFIGTLAFISIAVNATYAHVQHQYENGSAFVQRMQQQQTAPVAAPPVTYQSESSSPPPSRAAEIQTVNYAPAQAPMISMPQPMAEEPVVFIPIEARPSKPRLTEEERLSRRQEKEEKKEAREAAKDHPIVLSTNTVEVAKASDKESKREERQERKHTDEMTSNYSDPKATSQLSESHGDERAAATSAAPQATQEPEKNPRDKENHDDKIKKAVDAKAEETPKEAKSISTPKEKKPAPAVNQTPPHQSVFKRIVRGVVTGGQSGAEYQNQHPPSGSGQQRGQDQNNQNQNNQNRQSRQNQQNRNNGDGGNGGGRARH